MNGPGPPWTYGACPSCGHPDARLDFSGMLDHPTWPDDDWKPCPNPECPSNTSIEYVISRSGRVHESQCLALTHDGPCECPYVLAIYPPRRRPMVVGA